MKKYFGALLLFVALFITACGSGAAVYGTWTLEKVTKDGTSYTVDELKSLGESAVGSDVMSMADMTIVIKESDKSDSGSAFIGSAGQTAAVEWSLEGNKLKVGVQEGELDGDYLILSPNESSKMYFKKTSDSQDISSLPKSSGESAKDDSTEDVKPEEAASPTDDTTETDTSGDSYVSSTDYETILKNATSSIEQGIADINSEWESLKSDISSYDSYVSKSSDVEEFYKKILAKNAELCTIAYRAALDYAKAIASSSDSDSDKYKKSKDIDKEIYDDLCDIIKEGIYEDLFKAVKKHIYDGVLKHSDDAGVSYSDWYDTKSNEYDLWYDTKSDVYEEWYDSKSDIYSFYYDVASEFYSGDADKAQKKIDKFEEDIQKRVKS